MIKNNWSSTSTNQRLFIVLEIFLIILVISSSVLPNSLQPCAWLDRAIKRSGCTELVEAHEIVRGYNIGFGFSKDGNLLASGEFEVGGIPTKDGQGREIRSNVELWKLVNGKLSLTEDWTTNPAHAIALSPDGTRVAVATQTGLDIWEVQPNGVWIPHRFTNDIVSNLTFSPDGTILATFNKTALNLWNTSNDSLLNSIAVSGDANSKLGFAPDGTVLALDDVKGVTLYRIPDLSVANQFPNGEIMAFSADGAILATRVYASNIWLWQISDGKVIHQFEHNNTVRSVAFSPDNRFLVSATGGEMRWWDLTTGELLKTIETPVDMLAFSQENLLAAKMNDGNISLWQVSKP